MSRPDSGSLFFWGVDIPGLTKEQAEWLVGLVQRSEHPLHVILADPHEYLELKLDRPAVQFLKSVLDPLEPEPMRDGLKEDFEEWLRCADDLVDKS